MTDQSAPRPLRARRLIASAAVGAMLAGGGWYAGSSTTSTDAASRSGSAGLTARIPLETPRQTSIGATSEQLVRIEYPLAADTALSVNVTSPSWLIDADDQVRMVPSEGSEPISQPRDAVLDGSSVTASSDAHLQIDYLIDADVEPGTTGTVELTAGGQTHQVELSVLDEPFTPIGHANRRTPAPDDIDMAEWDEDHPVVGALNRWRDVPAERSPVPDQRRFVALRDAASPAGTRWVSDGFVYPGDRVDVLGAVANASRQDDVGVDGFVELVEQDPESPLLLDDVRLAVAADTDLVSREHLIVGHVHASRTQPMSAIATLESDFDVQLDVQDDTRFDGGDPTEGQLLTSFANLAAGDGGLGVGTTLDDGRAVMRPGAIFEVVQTVIVTDPQDSTGRDPNTS